MGLQDCGVRLMTFFDKLKSKCDCTVFMLKEKESNCLGSYCNITIRITLNTSLSYNDKIGVLAHELGHRWRHKRLKEKHQSGIVSETIAELYALHILLRNKQKKAIKIRLYDLNTYWVYWPYNQAKEIIKSRRIYRRCKEFINNQY